VDAAIASGIKLAVCSSNSQKNVELVVNSLGLVRGSNMEIFAGGRVVNRKPHPDIFNLAKGTMGVDAADCLVIEDDQVGLKAAKAANMACLITTSAYTSNDDLKLADRVVDSLEGIELENLVSLPRSMVGLNC
jgi:beta-phosphoglucomutase-like phosphatase (HAD superfamily)